MPTVKVRIAVAVDPSGNWHGSGMPGEPPTHADVEEFGDLKPGCANYWLTAEIQVPEPTTIAAEVSAVESEE